MTRKEAQAELDRRKLGLSTLGGKGRPRFFLRRKQDGTHCILESQGGFAFCVARGSTWQEAFQAWDQPLES